MSIAQLVRCGLIFSNPQKVGKGLFSYISYRIYTCIGLDRMAKNEYTVYRRFRDFKQLHEKLEDRYEENAQS